MNPQDPIPASAPSLSDTDYKRLWEQMVLFVDLYKHHFDLFVKGFVVHLAIIGSGAGLAFSDKLDPFIRRWLLILVVALSVVSVVAWIVSLRWAYRFAQSVRPNRNGAVANIRCEGNHRTRYDGVTFLRGGGDCVARPRKSTEALIKSQGIPIQI